MKEKKTTLKEKKKKRELKHPLMPNLGNGTQVHPKATKKGVQAPPFVETWQWHHWYPKTTK
jgi:hypothetical protein